MLFRSPEIAAGAADGFDGSDRVTLPPVLVGVMAEPGWSDAELPTESVESVEFVEFVDDAPLPAERDTIEVEGAVGSEVEVGLSLPDALLALAAAPATPERPPVIAPPRRQAVPPVTTRTDRAPVGVVASCPYCALLLEPPPVADRRCPRCREKIIVKRIDGRAVYLTEGSVLVFEAERRRVANSGRWTKERRRWLKAAAAVGAPAPRIARLEAASLSDAVVDASRSLYVTTVERTFRSAKRDKRWEEASRVMRDHALVLHRAAGSPVPPPPEIVKVHREGAAAALRGLAELSRDSELVGARCCDTCRADDGRTFRISQELRVPRLPHEGCPKGLCRCDWYLAVKDHTLVRRQLRRRARVEPRLS